MGPKAQGRKLISLGTVTAGQVDSDAAHSCNTAFQCRATVSQTFTASKQLQNPGKYWVHFWELQKNCDVLDSNWSTTPLLGVLEVWSKPTLACSTLNSALQANCMLIFPAVPSWMNCRAREIAQTVECLHSRREAQGSVCSTLPYKAMCHAACL